MAFSIPYVQTEIKSIAEDELSKLIDSEISIERLYFQPFNLLMLSNVEIKDKNDISAIKIEKIGAGINIWRLLVYQRIELTFAEIIGLDAQIYKKTISDSLNIQFIIDAFASKDPNKPKAKFDLTIHSVILRKCNIQYDNLYAPRASNENIFDKNHIKLSNIRADISLPKISNDDFEINLRRLSFNEKSGFILNSLKGKFHLTSDFISISDLHVLLPNTTISPNKIFLPINGLNNISDVINNEVIRFELYKNKLTLSDFKSFVPAFSYNQEPLTVSLSVEGNKRNIILNHLSVNSNHEDLSLYIKGNFFNPDSIKKSKIILEKIEFNAKSNSVKNIINSISHIPQNFKEIIYRCGDISLQSFAHGSIENVNFNGTLNSSAGSIDLDLSYLNTKQNNNISGSISINEFALNELLNNQKFGVLTSEVNIDLSIRHKKIDGSIILNAPLFTFNNYGYKNINIELFKEDNIISSDINIDDKNLNIGIDGTIDISKDKKRANLNIDFSDINLNALNLINKYEDFILNGKIISEFEGNNIDDLTGFVALNNLNFSNSSSNIHIDEFLLKVEEELVLLKSDIISGSLIGQYKLKRLPMVVKDILSSALPSIINHNNKTINLNVESANSTCQIEQLNMFDFNFTIKNDNRLTSFFNLPIRLIDDIDIVGHFDEVNGSADLMVNIPRFQQGKDKVIHDSYLNIEMDSQRDIFDLNLSTRLPGKNGDIFITLDGAIANGIIDTNISWAFDRMKFYKGDVSLSTMLNRDTLINEIGVDLNINRSHFFVNDTIWTIEPANIHYQNKKIKVNDINVWRTNQHVKINGQASENSQDTIKLDLENINLNYIFETLKINHVTFGGTATGKFYATNLFTREPIAFTPALNVKSLSYNDALLGDAVIKSRWVNDEKKVEILADIRDGDSAYAKLNGGIWVTKDSLSMDFETKKVNIKFLQPFMSAFSTDVEGRASGNALLYGTFKDINLKGDVFADTICMRVDYTNTYYSGSDSVHFRPNLIYINDFKLHDKYGNTAMLNGYVTHNYLRDAGFNFKITKVNNLLCYDTNPTINPDWYGTIFGNGSCDISGEPGIVSIKVAMSTAPNSEFTFVLNDKQNVSDYKFLTFSDKSKTSKDNKLSLTENNLIAPSIFDLELKVTVTNDALMTLVMDPIGGDRIKAYGEGGIQIGYNSSSESMSMGGSYTIDRGEYNFTLQDIIIKEFKIKNGSSVKFDGNPFNANLDITALYRVNTNLSDLDKSFSTDKDLNRTNVPVDAVLMVKGKLQSPEITFDVELPTLTQDVVRKVKSIISTEDMMNRQIIYLLALNRFYTPEYMGSTSNNNELASVASSTISSQLSNILGELSSNWSFSPYFRTDKGDFSDVEVDLALSSTLLNNRLLLNGNFGYRDRSTSSTTFIGDFDIEYLLNRQGTLRLKAYNHYNDQNYYLKSALTTQGIGIILKHDFNKLFDFKKDKSKQNVEKNDSIIEQDSIK